jgi:prevent-host-death family protein
MKLSTQIKPISYLKSNTAQVLIELTQSQEALVITQNGEAKAVMQDVKSYEQTQETLALLKILALGNRQIEEKNVQPATKVLRNIRKRRNEDR